MYEKFVTFHIGNKRIRFFQTANVFLNSTPPTFITLTCVLSHKTPHSLRQGFGNWQNCVIFALTKNLNGQINP